jgi:5'-phosphate synthase pdxT subunit
LPSVAGSALDEPVVGAVRPGARRGARPRVGVLSLQGDFALHAAALTALDCEPVRVSLPEHLEALAALVLPGGESSTMLRLLDSTGLRAPLERFVRERPVLGTCAGLILLAREADKLPRPTLGVLDISAERNAWGRQVHSFSAAVQVPALGGEVPGMFIRAPRITRVGPGVEVIARYAGEPVGVRHGHAAALTFHPELTGDRRLHAWFLREVAGLDVGVPR